MGCATHLAGLKISGGAVEALSAVNILAIGTRRTLAINPQLSKFDLGSGRDTR
jgi:hypothetical protein